MTNCKCIGDDIETPEPLKCRCHDVALVDGRYEHATVIVEAGCIISVEAGEIPLYTPHVCCTGVGAGSGSGTQGRPGDKGEPGENATITIGAVNTLAPGSQATVKNVGSATNAVLEFGIPAGAQGSTGQSSSGVTSDVAGISIDSGSITSLPPTWPPIMYPLATTADPNVKLTVTKDDSNGMLTIAIDTTQYDTEIKKYITTQINNLNTTIQGQITALNTALSSAQASIADLQTRVSRLGG